MPDESPTSQSIKKDVTCPSCGGNLIFNPQTKALRCEHCSTDVTIEQGNLTVDELNFEEHLKLISQNAEQQTVTTTRCEGCGAKVTLEDNIVSDRCPFCSSILVIKNQETHKQIKPGAILPFGLSHTQATEQFRDWIKKLHFAPNKLKKELIHNEKLNGIYIPYWTYDADTFTDYIGRRGDKFIENHTYTTIVNGKPVSKTATKTQIRWTDVSGFVEHKFDDVLVIASESLPRKYAVELEPWDLTHLVPFDALYLSGYKTETYQIDLKQGYSHAKDIMSNIIDDEIKKDIGGDLQVITVKKTQDSNITFKHILLPIYISSFTYRKKIYRFLVNARTGEVQGERPYSVWKITFTLLVIIAIVVALMYLGTIVKN